MTDVQFEGENYRSKLSVQGNNEPDGLIGLILRTGVVKDETQANVILIIIFIIITALTFFIIWSKVLNSEKNTNYTDYKKVDQSRYIDFR